MPRWFYIRDGQEYGPLTERGMRELLHRGKLRPDSTVKRYDDHDPDHDYPWVPLQECGLLDPHSAALSTVASPIQVPPASEQAPITRLPLLQKLTAGLAALCFTVELVNLLFRLPTQFTAMQAGEYLLSLPSHSSVWLLRLEERRMELLVLHFLCVLLWQATAIDVLPLLRAEVITYPPSSVWWWIVPGANLYHSRLSMMELWSLSRDPRAWSRGGIHSSLLISWWWLGFLLASVISLSLLVILRNMGRALTDGRMDHWHGQLSLLTVLRDAAWALHLCCFLALLWRVAKMQDFTLRFPAKRKVAKD